MSTHANMVKMTVSSVSATPSTGKGDITLNAASTGFQSFADAYGANATVDILITKGAEWEVARNCTYTHSGTTLTRGTWEDSSNGTGAIVADNTAVVSVVATADSGRRWDSAALEHSAVSGTSGGVTMEVGKLHTVDASSWSASRVFTLPAVAPVGSRTGVVIITSGLPDTVQFTAASGDTAGGVAGGTNWGEIGEARDLVIWRCVTADTTWVLDTVIVGSANVVVTSDTAQSLTGSGAATTLTTGYNVVTTDTYGWWNGSTGVFNPKRQGKYAVFASMQAATGGQLQLNIVGSNGAASISGYFPSLSMGAYCVVTTSGVLYFDGQNDSVVFSVYNGSSTQNTAAGGNTGFSAVYLGP